MPFWWLSDMRRSFGPARWNNGAAIPIVRCFSGRLVIGAMIIFSVFGTIVLYHFQYLKWQKMSICTQWVFERGRGYIGADLDYFTIKMAQNSPTTFRNHFRRSTPHWWFIEKQMQHTTLNDNGCTSASFLVASAVTWVASAWWTSTLSVLLCCIRYDSSLTWARLSVADFRAWPCSCSCSLSLCSAPMRCSITCCNSLLISCWWWLSLFWKKNKKVK